MSVPSSSVKSIASSVTGRARPASLTERRTSSAQSDSERSVVRAAASHGVQVRAEQERPRARRSARAEQPSGSRPSRCGSRGLPPRHARGTRLARLEMRCRERRPLEPAVGRCSRSGRAPRSRREGGPNRREGTSRAMLQPRNARRPVHRGTPAAASAQYSAQSRNRPRHTSIRHPVVMTDNGTPRRDLRSVRRRMSAIRIASTGTPSRRYCPRRSPSRSKPKDSYSAMAGSFQGKT